MQYLSVIWQGMCFALYMITGTEWETGVPVFTESE